MRRTVFVVLVAFALSLGLSIGQTPIIPRADAAAVQRRDIRRLLGQRKPIQPTMQDVDYNDHVRTTLDFWKAPSDSPTPLIVFIHGGGFRGGDKKQARRRYAGMIRACMDAGVSFASLNYCMTGDGVDILHCLHDCAYAVQYLRHHADRFNLDGEHIACFGGSAGAGTSLWLGAHEDLADPTAEDPVEHQSTRLSACGQLNGQCTYDFLRWPELIGPPPDEKAYVGEMKRLLHADSREELESPGLAKHRRELDMYAMLDPTDAPVFLFSPGKLGDATSRGHYIHHPRHAIVIHERAQEIGLDSMLLLPARDPSVGGRKMEEEMLLFFFKHFGMDVE